MNPEEIRSELARSTQDLHEIAEVRVFTAYRPTSDGGEEKITLTFSDFGEGFQAGRYWCVVSTEDGRTATGNPADEVDIVLHTIHWNDLEKDPPIREIVIEHPDGEVERLKLHPADDG